MQVCKYRTDQGVFTALVGEPGRKLIPVVTIDHPIRVRKVPMTEQKYMVPLEYPVKKAVRGFLKAGKALGMTKSARTFLKGATS